MARPNRIDTSNEYLGKAEEFNIDTIGSGEPPAIEIVDRVVTGDEYSLDAFMHEPMTVMVHDSTDENDAELVYVSVNGNRQFFLRGQPQTVKRYFVERLARAKMTTYKQNLDDRLGESMNNMIPHHALRFPFSVVEDKNPRGAAWLRNLLAERT
jgi:hypothetical protein